MPQFISERAETASNEPIGSFTPSSHGSRQPTHYVYAHVDLDAHTSSTLATIKSLFDATITQTADDHWEIQ